MIGSFFIKRTGSYAYTEDVQAGAGIAFAAERKGSNILYGIELDFIRLRESFVNAGRLFASAGGNLFIGKHNQLIADVNNSQTTIDVKYNNLTNGDRILLDSNANVEWMAVTSSSTPITGGYRYSVTRNLDGSGANSHYKNDPITNTGSTGDGFIEIFSANSIKGATQPGPTIVGSIRASTTYNDIAETWAIGNLNGLYGYSATAYGAAFGKYASGVPNLTVDSTNGIRIRNYTAQLAQWDTNGNILIGETGTGKSNVYITSGAVKLRNNVTDKILLDTDGSITIGQVAAGQSNVYITAGAIKLRNNTADMIELNAAGNAYFKGMIELSGSGGVKITGAGVGANGFVIDVNGIRGYSSTLGLVFDLPTNGTAPTFSSGKIKEVTFEIYTSGVIRTSATVGDGSVSSAGLLMNPTGIYGCKANQLLANANVKILADGTFSFTGDSNNQISWNGSSLAVKGSITLVNTISADSITDGTTNKVYTSTEKTKLGTVAANADVTLSAINGLLTVTGGGIKLSAGGKFCGGKDTYADANVGFFLGYESAAYKFKIYNSATKYFQYDGTDFSLVGGTITGGTVQNSIDALTHVAIVSTGLDIGGISFTATSGYLTQTTFLDLGSTTSVNEKYFKIKTTLGTELLKIRLGVNDAIYKPYFGNGVSASSYYIGESQVGSGTPTIDSSGNINIGAITAASSSFLVNSSGQLTKVNNLAPTAGLYLRGDGTSFSPLAIQVADVPTLNQNTTGNAATVTNGVYTNANNSLSGNNTTTGSVMLDGEVEITPAGAVSQSVIGKNTLIIYINDVPYTVTLTGATDGQLLFVSNDKDSVDAVLITPVRNGLNSSLSLTAGKSAFLRYRSSELTWYSTGF